MHLEYSAYSSVPPDFTPLRGLWLTYKLTQKSGRMLEATKAGDVLTMTGLLEYAHSTHSPLPLCTDEAELASIIRRVYLKTLDTYRIERKDKAGVGYVDSIFCPFIKG